MSGTLESYRASLDSVLEHPECPEKPRIIETIREEIIGKIRSGELSFVDGRGLVDQIDSHTKDREMRRMESDNSVPVYAIPFPNRQPADRPPAA